MQTFTNLMTNHLATLPLAGAELATCSFIIVHQQEKGPSLPQTQTRGQAVARIADRTASQQTLLISDCCQRAFAPMKLLQSHRRVPCLTATSLLYWGWHRVYFGRRQWRILHCVLVES